VRLFLPGPVDISMLLEERLVCFMDEVLVLGCVLVAVVVAL